MFKRILAGILSAAIVFSSLTPAVNATESVVVSQEETTDQEVIEEEITEEEKEEDKIESEINESVEEFEIKEEQMVETAIIEEVVAEEQIAQTMNTAAPIDESDRGEIATGTCGDNLTWVLYDDGELLINGSGAMDDGENGYNYSWDDYAEEIKMVVISDGITTIGQSAFTGFDNLKKISIPSSVLIIEDYAFETCASIEDIVLPEGLESIGKTAFGRCKALKTISLPKTIKSIEAYAFQNTDSLETVFYNGTWNDWVEFSRTLKENIYIKDSQICTIQKYVSEKNENDTITITGAGEGGLGGKIQIPEEIDGLKVTAIGEQAFLNNKKIKSVTFSSSVETIGSSAFYGCELSEINFETGLKCVMDYAFYDSLDDYNYELILPKGLETIGSNAFSGIDIKSVTVPASVEEIGLPSFDWGREIIFDGSAQKWVDIHGANTKNLPTLLNVSFSESEQAYVPYVDSNGNITGYELALWRDATGDIEIREKFKELPVISIRQSAFADNETITSVVVPEYIKSIGNGAFQNCVNLVEAKINTKETSVPWQVFQGCISLKKVTLPPLITYVGSDAFDQCISLEEVSFESSYNWRNVIKFDNGNESLKNAKTKNFKHGWGYKIVDHNNVEAACIIGITTATEVMDIPAYFHEIPVKYIGDYNADNTIGIFQDNETIKKVIIPNGVEELYQNTFKGCIKLEEVVFGDSLKEIRESAFKDCILLEKIVLPKEMESLGISAFEGCKNLTEIVLPEKIKYGVGDHIFAGCTSLKSITIPKYVSVGDHMFEGCTSLERIVIAPDYDEHFGCHAFAGCKNVKEIIMPTEYFGISSNYDGCSHLSWDEVRESVFEDVPRNAKVKVVKDSYPYRQMVELGFTNLSVAIVLQKITLPTTVSVELGKEKTLSVTKVPTNANDTLNLEWASLDENIASVDENGKITGHRMGSVLISVKDLNSGKTARTTVQVVLPAKSKITVKTDPVIDAIGLQTGESVKMQIFATEAGTEEPLDSTLFTFTSSDDSIAIVDETGLITSVYNGTKSLNVKITAALKNDSAARKVYLSVKTIPVQVETLGYYLSEEFEAIGDTYVVPKSKVKDADYQIQVYAQPLSATEELLTPTLKWTTSNSKVATVSKDGLVTVKKNADGIAKITATVNDLKKVSVSFEIDVRDYNPRLAANTVTLNTNTFDGAQVQMYPVYGTDITAVRLEGNDSFDVDYIPENRIHTLNVVADGVVKNGTYKLTLISTIEGIGEYEQSFNVKVANSVPAITLKQKAPFNLFYSDNEAIVSVAAKNAIISNVELSDTETFKGEFNEDTQEFVISYDDRDSILDKKATFTVTLKDYRNPITKTFNINAKETKPTLAVSRKSTNLSALSGEGVPLQITNKALNKLIDWDEDKCDVRVADTSIAYVTTAHEGTDLTIQPILDENKFANGKTSHSAKLEIQGENWLKPIVVTHTISIVTKNPTIKASQSTLTLNSLFGNTVETTIVPSLSNCPEPYAYEFKAAKELEDYKKIKLEVQEGWNLKASFKNPDDLPAKGNYKYDVLAQIDGVEDPIKTTVTVKVAESKPKVTLEKTSVTLNKTIADQIDFAAKITAGYEITDMNISRVVGNVLNDDQLAVTFKPETGRVYVEILDKNVENKTYKYQLKPTVKMDGIEKEVELNPLVLSVKVYGNNVSISATGKGGIDLVTRESGIIYTITGGKNFNYHVNDVCIEETKLVGNDAEFFEIEVLEANAKGQPQIMVKAKESVDFSTAVTYKYKLAVKINHLEKEVESAEFKIKVKQSALSLKAQVDLTVYQSVKNGKISIEVVKPVDAKVKEMQILETKATTVPKDALSYELEKKADGSYVLNYQVINPEKLKANAGYKLSLAVTPEGNALNKATQTFTITLKVKR